MFVCMCNALRDRELEAAATQDVNCVSEVFRRCGSRPRCGKCVPHIAEMIEKSKTSASSEMVLAE